MSDPSIKCPSCGEDIKLTDGLAAPLIAATKAEYDKRLADARDGIQERERTLEVKRVEIQESENLIAQKVEKLLASQRKKISEDEAKRAKLSFQHDLSAKAQEVEDLQKVLKEREGKLGEAQKAQVELIRKTRELDDKSRELDLKIEQKLQASLETEKLKVKRDVEESMKLKVSEKEQKILSMQRQIESLKQKAEQGSQQLQGEVLELELENTLRGKFPFDIVEPVAKGELGADVIQRVVAASGQVCGSILWETKRTKNWSDGWLPKLRGDQRSVGSEIAVIVSQSLPNTIESFGQLDGTWISAPKYAVPLAIALRQSLVEVNNARLVQDGQQTKTEQVYEYLTGSRFRHRIEAIVEKFSTMQDDLNKERRAMTRLWSKRESQIHGVIEATVGMYGDLEGIAGQAIQSIEGLEHSFIEKDESEG